MTTSVVRENAKEIARSPQVLVPLIQKDWDDAKEASDRAVRPYYAAIGEKLVEAKSGMTWAEFNDWVERNFEFGKSQAQRYMQNSNTTFTLTRAREDTSLSEAIRQSGGSPRGSDRGGASWHQPVKEALDRAANIRNLHEESLKREAEREAERKLAVQLIDIGYKALATKLHPDHGGSREAMARLNHVRDRLKKFV